MTTILTVDDEKPVRTLIKKVLERRGFTCITASCVAEARALLEQKDPELILLDIRMPGESGLDLLRHLRENGSDAAVIMVTVIDDPFEAATILELGANGYVTKPFGANELLIQVTNALCQRKLTLENRAYRQNLETLVAERTAALLESEEHLRLLMESATGFAVYQLAYDPNSPELARVVFVSPSIKEITGVTETERLTNLFANANSSDLERLMKANQRSWECGVTFDETFRVFHFQKKEWRWIRAISNGVPGPDGHVRHANGIVLDITLQVEAEQAFKISQERYALATAAARVGSLGLGSDHWRLVPGPGGQGCPGIPGMKKSPMNWKSGRVLSTLKTGSWSWKRPGTTWPDIRRSTAMNTG